MKIIFAAIFAFSLLADVTSAAFEGISMSNETTVECVDYNDTSLDSKDDCESDSDDSHCHCHMGHSHVSLIITGVDGVELKSNKLTNSINSLLTNTEIQNFHQEINRPPIA